MNIQEVIEKSEQIVMPNLYLHNFFSSTVIMMFIVLIGAMGSILISSFIGSKINSGVLTLIVFVAMMWLMVSSTKAFYEWRESTIKEYGVNVENWKRDYVYPYILTLKHEDEELVSIEYSSKSSVERDMVVKYKDEDLITNTLELPMEYMWGRPKNAKTFEIIYDVPKDKKGFVRLYELEKDLGHGVMPGKYGLEIHLNKK